MTTTDPFTAAASDRALSIAMETFKPDFDPENHPSVYRLLVDMAEWARTHLAAQEPTDAEVLAALNADYAIRFGPRNLPADSLEPYGEETVQIMRAALSAARAARRDEENR